MTDRDPTQPTEHENRVAREMDEEARDAGDLTSGGPVDRFAADARDASSETEVEAERRGTTADDVEDEVDRDERTPLDAAYTPKSG